MAQIDLQAELEKCVDMINKTRAELDFCLDIARQQNNVEAAIHLLDMRLHVGRAQTCGERIIWDIQRNKI